MRTFKGARACLVIALIAVIAVSAQARLPIGLKPSALKFTEPPFDTTDRSKIDFDKVVHLKNYDVYSLVGSAKLEEVNRYLKARGLTAKPQGPNKEYAKVVIAFSITTEAEGCGCPPIYSEFSVSTDIMPVNKSNSVMHSGRLITVSNHPQRVASLFKNFGSKSLLGEIVVSKKKLFVKVDDRFSLLLEGDLLRDVVYTKTKANMNITIHDNKKLKYKAPYKFFFAIGDALIHTQREPALKQAQIVAEGHLKRMLEKIVFQPIRFDHLYTREGVWGWFYN